MGVASDAMSAAGKAAAAGSVVPGIGTAVGAGLGGLFGLVQSLFSNHAASQQQQAQLDAAKQQFLAQLVTGQADLAGNQLTENQQRDQAYFNSFQQDPVSQQKDLFRAGALRSLAGSGAPQIGPGSVSPTNAPDFSGAASQFLSDSALSAGASNFYGAAGRLQPDATPPNLAALGLADPGGGNQANLLQQVMDARKKRQALLDQQTNALGQAYNIGAGPASNVPPNWMSATASRSTPQDGLDYFNRKTSGGSNAV